MKQLTSYIETMLDEIFIFSEYLNIPTYIIEECLTSGRNIKNPLRVDKHPSATFNYRNNKVRLRDFARPEYGGDIYQVVGITLGLDSNVGKDFITICNHITTNLISNANTLSKYKPTSIKLNDYAVTNIATKTFTKIDVEYDTWNNDTFMYWYNYVKPNKTLAKILLKELQTFNIYPIKRFWLGNNNRATRTNKNSNIYAYLLKIDSNGRHYKLYLPNSSPKFYTNASDTFNYIDKLKTTKIGIITKSIKDTIILNSIAKYLRIDNDITFIPINSESTNISLLCANKIKLQYEEVYTFFDWDYTGFSNAFINYMNYDFKAIFITNKEFNPNSIISQAFLKVKTNITYDDLDEEELTAFTAQFKIKDNKVKDFSDYLIEYGVDKAIKLFIIYFNSLIDK